ncbi:MAG: lytic murein transglycosylase [Solirubrobacteraceae bacterium]|nr:lytic murein transglycosylase [Solirubrobacteraceae bacterium]
MKNSSLGSLIALSALAVAPSAALAQDATTPTGPTTPDPAPVLTTPAATQQTPGLAPTPTPGVADAPQAQDPTTPSSQRRQRRAEAREDQGERKPAAQDPVPTEQATDPSLIAPSQLEVQAVPNFFIEDFNIPPFLLPIYQAAGSEYGIRWEVLAAINRIETAFGTNLNVSTAGALGWMQFMPSTWESYGVDANGDGQKDPFNPADAIFAAARYLKAAGGDEDLRKAIFAYNHADWYVDDVMDNASKIASIPEPIISSLAALTQGIFPVDAADRSIDYRGKLKSTSDKDKKVAPGDDASDTVEGEADINSIEVTAPAESRVVAVQDGVVEKVGQSERLGTYVRLRDAYGNRYTYAHLGEVQDKVPVPKPGKDKSGHDHSEDDEPTTDQSTDAGTSTVDAGTTPDATPTTPAQDPAPTQPATDGKIVTEDPSATTPDEAPAKSRSRVAAREIDEKASETNPADTPRRIRFRARSASETADAAAEPVSTDKSRLFAHPTRPEAYAAGGEEQLNPEIADADAGTDTNSLAEYFSIDYGLKPSDVKLHALKAGTHVIAGTVLGKLAKSTDGSDESTLTFEIRPAGKKGPRIDPKPILDGWRLMDRTAFYKAQQLKAVEAGEAGDDVTAGQVLLMSKAELQERVLSDKRINIYECGRRDIQAGIIDRRILALLEYLAVKGVEPSVSSLQCGHGMMTSSGNVSEHSTGTAVDISTAYGEVITPATQGEGSITDRAVREILKLQGAMKPHQIITLMKYAGEDNTLAMGDHDDHIHVGYRPISGNGGKRLEQLLKPGQWDDLLAQLSSIKVPDVSAEPSQYSVTVKKTGKADDKK